MPDNIEYAYYGYAVTLLVLGGLAAWIYWRFMLLTREAQEVERLEQELAEERQTAPDMATAVPKET